MGTYGEFTHGAAKGAKHVLGIFVGTGVGGGIILNGELYSGFNYNAGEIGHIILHWRRGTELESIAGRKYQMKRAKKLLDDAPKRIRKKWKNIEIEKMKSSQMAEMFAQDDPVVTHLVDDAAKAHRGRHWQHGELPEPGSDRHWRRRGRGAGRCLPRPHLGDRPALHATRRRRWSALRARGAQG